MSRDFERRKGDRRVSERRLENRGRPEGNWRRPGDRRKGERRATKAAGEDRKTIHEGAVALFAAKFRDFIDAFKVSL